jgi:hypothetical protein
MPSSLGHYSFKDEVRGNSLNHPPIPGDSTGIGSTRDPGYTNTGNQPGPGSTGPIDPRLAYPRMIAVARPTGQGCSSCKWNGVCKLLFWQINFGDQQENQTEQNGKVSWDTNIGRACESWNGPFPMTLPGEDYDSDGLGLGDPYTAGTIPPEAQDPLRYDGQYGDMLFPGPSGGGSQNS